MVVVATSTNLISIAKNQWTAIETTAIDFQHDHAAVGGNVWGRLVSTPAHEALVQLTEHFSTLFSIFSDFLFSYSSSLSPPFLFFITCSPFLLFLARNVRKMPVRQIYNHHARKMLWREQQQPVVVVLQNVQLFFCFFLMTPAAMGKSTCTTKHRLCHYCTP